MFDEIFGIKIKKLIIFSLHQQLIVEKIFQTIKKCM